MSLYYLLKMGPNRQTFTNIKDKLCCIDVRVCCVLHPLFCVFLVSIKYTGVEILEFKNVNHSLWG